jgi:UDP-glucose 4-epimerase
MPSNRINDSRPVAEIIWGKVLVTGASGFIGKHLCHSLVQQGAEVHGISRTSQNLQGMSIKWWQADLTDAATTKRIMNEVRPDVIFHLAAYAWGGRELDLVLPTFNGCMTTTVNVLLAATEVGCHRIVIPGSLEEPFPGEGNAVPSSPYAAAKLGGTLYALMFHELYGTPAVIVRIFMTYGPGQHRDKLIPYLIRSLTRGEKPKLHSGSRPVDWIFIDDVVRGLMVVAQTPGLEGQRVDIGSGVLVSIRDTASLLSRLIGQEVLPPNGAFPDRPNEQVRIADISTSFRLTGWKPEVPFEQGLSRTIDWYENTP